MSDMRHRNGWVKRTGTNRGLHGRPLAQKLMVPLYQIALVRERALPFRRRKIGGSADAKKLLAPLFRTLDRECFYVVALDTQHKIIGANLVSVGSLTTTQVHPREVFKPAVLLSAAAVIVAHNHPGGNPKPSPEDRAITLRLVNAGRTLGIEVLDHLIFADNRCVSFADRGWMPSRRT